MAFSKKLFWNNVLCWRYWVTFYKEKTKKSFEIIVLLSALFPRLSSIFWNKGAHKKMMRAILFHGCYRVNLISLSPSIGYLSFNHISHTQEALDFIFLCNRHSHSGHGIKQVRSSYLHFFNKLLQVKSSWED